VRGCFAVITLVFLSGSLGKAQIAVENPRHLDLPEERAQMLHQIICRVAADQLRLRGLKTNFPVILVLGEAEERIWIGDGGMPRKIYLGRWDEQRFATADMQLVVQDAAMNELGQSMTKEVLRRWKRVAPAQTGELNSGKSTLH
jgi:hypothetical protein